MFPTVVLLLVKRKSKSPQTHRLFSFKYNSLGWKYCEVQSSICIEQFEQVRTNNRRSNAQLRMPASYRQSLLTEEWDVPISNILRTIIDTNEIRTQRQKTASRCKKIIMREERIKDARRSLKKLFRLRGDKRRFKRESWMDSDLSHDRLANSLPNIPDSASIDSLDSSSDTSNSSSSEELPWGAGIKINLFVLKCTFSFSLCFGFTDIHCLDYVWMFDRKHILHQFPVAKRILVLALLLYFGAYKSDQMPVIQFLSW